MKETKVYVDELPNHCTDCPCYDFDIGGCQCKDPHFTYDLINRFNGCPLIDIKSHDRELVNEVCEKIRNFLLDKCEFDYGYYINDGDFTVPDLWYFLDQIQKEYEK